MATRPHEGGGAAALPLNLLAQAIPMLSRHELAALTERLIECLDLRDGDPEAEDDTEDCCSAADDGCWPVFVQGVRRWGSEWDDQGI